MSYIIKLGARAITRDMMAGETPHNWQKSATWHYGFYAGLNAVGAITDEELEDLNLELDGGKK